MTPRQSHIPRRKASRRHSSYAGVFVIALLLPAIVGTLLYFTTAQVIAQTAFGATLGVTARAKGTLIRRSAPVVVPTTIAVTPALTLATPPILLTPVAIVVATAVATSTSPFIATISVAPIPAPFILGHVGNTQGDGVFLRHTPRLSDHWIAWVDNTPLVMLGNEQDGDGQHWLQVRDPRNDVGWVPAQFVTH